MERTLAKVRGQFQELVDSPLPATNSLKPLFIAHAHAMLKLLPALENHPSFNNFEFWTSLYCLVMRSPNKRVELRAWGESGDRYRLYLYDPTIGENGLTYDEQTVAFDQIIPTLESYVQKLRQPSTP